MEVCFYDLVDCFTSGLLSGAVDVLVTDDETAQKILSLN
nr:sugar-binding domain-containing protein [Salinicoccus sediminis]